MKNFQELLFENGTTKESQVASYLDDALSEENLIEKFGSNPLVYGLIATNMHLSNNILYDLSYPILVDEKPTTQAQIDDIFSRLGL